MDFFRDFQKIFERDNKLTKMLNTISNFIQELNISLTNNVNNKDIDIVTQISSVNKLSIATENEIDKQRTNILQKYADNTKSEGSLYFIFNKVKDENVYRVWEFSNNSIIRKEINKYNLPKDVCVNSIMRIENNNFILDIKATKSIETELINKANKIIDEQNKKIEEYKKDGHIYVVTEDIKGRVFLWDSTEKPKYEIEDVDFPEELKEKAKEGNSFLYQNGKYTHIS